MIGAESGKGVRGDGDAAAERMVVVEDVVAHPVVGGAVLDVECPPTIVGDDDRVVVDEVPCRSTATIDSVERDAARMIVEEQVVADNGALDPIHIDARASPQTVAVDSVVLDHGSTDDAVPTLRGISIHMNAIRSVVPDPVASDRRSVATVTDIDPVLVATVGGVIRFDQEIVAESGEDAPTSVAVQAIAAKNNVLA